MADYSLTWLPSVLRAAGLTVVEQPGWKMRGHGNVGKILGVLCHHTAGPRKGNAPSLKIVQNGRPDLPGPLAQLVLGRDGTFYVVAAGRCYHAGAGVWHACKNGNTNLIGIEAENTGLPNDNPWPAVQLDAYARGVAAILRHVGAPASMAVGHLEYALPVGRKSDPSFSVGDRAARITAMDHFRARVSAIMFATPATRLLDEAPAADAPGDVDEGPGDADHGDADDAGPQPDAFPAERDSDTVATVQRRLRALGYYGVGNADGDMAALTRGAIVAFKHDNGLAPETPEIDDAFLAALMVAKPRPVSDARANATPADLAPKNQTIWALAKDRLIKLVTAAGATVMAIASYVGEKFRDTWESLGTFRDALGQVPLWVWLGLAAGILIAGYEFSRRAENDTVDKFRRGELQ